MSPKTWFCPQIAGQFEPPLESEINIFQTWKARNAAKSPRFFFAQERARAREGKKSFPFFYNYDAFVIWVFLLWLVEKVAKQFVWKSCHLQEKQERSNRDFSVFCREKCRATHLLSHENLSSKIVSLTVNLGCRTRAVTGALVMLGHWKNKLQYFNNKVQIVKNKKNLFLFSCGRK